LLTYSYPSLGPLWGGGRGGILLCRDTNPYLWEGIIANMTPSYFTAYILVISFPSEENFQREKGGGGDRGSQVSKSLAKALLYCRELKTNI
jgi:hypothetical protein